MKTAIFSFFIYFLYLSNPYSQTSLSGKVTQLSSGIPIQSARVTLYEDNKRYASVLTDSEGKYSFSEIKPCVYDVEVNFTGFVSQLHRSVNVKLNITNHLDFELSEDVLIEHTIINDFEKPLLKTKIEDAAIRPIYSESLTPHFGISAYNDLTMRSTPAGTRRYYKEDVTGMLLTNSRSDLPKSGQMTAGEWNDLHNWKDWLDLLKEENYGIMMERFDIHPANRYAVLVVNEENSVLANVPVQLLDHKEKVIWETFTDNSGRAELWENAFVDNQLAFTIKVRNQVVRKITKIEDGTNTIVLKEACYSPAKMDIVFVVDATSSMDDEITYLKSELIDVISRIEEANNTMDFNLGSVFYRDVRDSYLTRISPLSSNHEDIINFVGQQNSSGGGDNPEAVDAALDETLQLSWRTDALKIVFLILDAPPHEDEITMYKIRSQIKDSAAKGIKLIPVTASGIDRETEFLMKFMAILTNGTYVFITDDSGIGNAHLDPVVSDYVVEKLNDCLVRLISQYSKSYSCDVDLEVKSKGIEVNIFPNPSTQFINVSANRIPDKIKVYSSNGMMIKSISPSDKDTRIELNDYVNGIYTISIIFGDQIETRQIILLK